MFTVVTQRLRCLIQLLLHIRNNKPVLYIILPCSVRLFVFLPDADGRTDGGGEGRLAGSRQVEVEAAHTEGELWKSASGEGVAASRSWSDISTEKRKCCFFSHCQLKLWKCYKI